MAPRPAAGGTGVTCITAVPSRQRSGPPRRRPSPAAAGRQ